MEKRSRNTLIMKVDSVQSMDVFVYCVFVSATSVDDQCVCQMKKKIETLCVIFFTHDRTVCLHGGRNSSFGRMLGSLPCVMQIDRQVDGRTDR